MIKAGTKRWKSTGTDSLSGAASGRLQATDHVVVVLVVVVFRRSDERYASDSTLRGLVNPFGSNRREGACHYTIYCRVRFVFLGAGVSPATDFFRPRAAGTPAMQSPVVFLFFLINPNGRVDGTVTEPIQNE